MNEVYIPKHPSNPLRGARRKTKYGNKKVSFQGRVFDSIIERDRYVYLQAAQSRGEIRNLRCQVSFDLDVNGEHICKYIADFVYEVVDDISWSVVEDVKGMVTPIFKLKAKLMLAVHGIEVKVVKSPTDVIG